MVNTLGLPAASPSQSYWQQEGQKKALEFEDSIVPFPASCDVAIIGGGFAGIATAYHLLKADNPPASVILLEAREPCSGATGRNGGNLRADRLMAPARLCKRYGPTAAFEIMQFEVENVNMIKDLLREEAIECDLHDTTSLLVLTTSGQVAAAREMYDVLRGTPPFDKTALDDLTFYEGNDAPHHTGMVNAKGYISMSAARLSSYKLLVTLLNRCVEMGLAFKSHTPVLSVQSAGSVGQIIRTQTGEIIKARKVVYATNAYTSTLLPEYSTAIVPCKGFACHIAGPEGKRLPTLPTSSLVSMEQDPASDTTGYNYMIQLADNTIVVGGAHHKYDKGQVGSWYNNIDDGRTIKEAQQYFEDDYMQRAFVGWKDSHARIDSAWTGIMGYSADSLPHVGAVPGRQGSFVLAGFNGHGMPVIYKAAKGIADMIVRDMTYEQTGLPSLYETTWDRLTSKRDDILGGRGLRAGEKKET